VTHLTARTRRHLRWRRPQRQDLLAPLEGADVIFLVDRLVPRLGMEKAALRLIHELDAHARVGVLVVAGPPPAAPLRRAVFLGHRNGSRGRIAAMLQLRRVARQPGAEFVAVGTWAATTFSLANLGGRAPLILWEHTVLPWRIRHERSVTVCALALRFLLGRTVRTVVSVGDANARTVEALTGHRVPTRVIPNFPEKDAETPAAQPRRESTAPMRNSVSLLGIGSLIPRKNWALAITALTHLPDHVELSLAGDGPDRDELSRLAHELGVDQRVTFLGYVESVGPLLDRADVIIHPSFAETFGYVLMEAAFHRKPVVVLDMPAMNEFVPSLVCGAIADRPEPVDYARAIEDALGTDWHHDEAESRRAKRLNSNAIVAAWLDVLPSQ
jgi:glycosyltransferase involved in cell wall biosynthesis